MDSVGMVAFGLIWVIIRPDRQLDTKKGAGTASSPEGLGKPERPKADLTPSQFR